MITSECAAQTGGLGLRTLQLNDIAVEARDILESARREAASLLSEIRARGEAEITARCKTELTKAHTEGYEAGFAEGLEAGRDAGYAQALEEARRDYAEKHASLSASCASIISEINKDRDAWRQAARQDLIDLAITLANRVVHCIGQRDREVVLRNLEEVIRLVGARTDVVIAVHPTDAATARMFSQTLTDAREQWKHIQVIEEPEISPGGCRVRWGTGAADAQLETQFERIVTELRGEKAETAPPKEMP